MNFHFSFEIEGTKRAKKCLAIFFPINDRMTRRNKKLSLERFNLDFLKFSKTYIVSD